MTNDSDVSFYGHSGKLGNSVPLILLLGIPVSVVMAAVYAYLVVYVPLVGYVNILFLGGYVLGTGFVLQKLAKMGKCRNVTVLYLLGGIVGAVGLYAAWVFFFKAMWGEELSAVRLAAAPQDVWELAVVLNAQGWWEGGPTGILQWVTAGIETLTFIIGCGWMTAQAIDREVFCEDCNSWCEQTAEQHLKITEEFAATLEIEEKSDWQHFDILKLPVAEPDEYPRFVGETLKCTGCGETSAIRLNLLTLKQGDKGPEVESKESTASSCSSVAFDGPASLAKPSRTGIPCLS